MKFLVLSIVLIFGYFPLNADEEIDYLVKTMSWTGIHDKLKDKKNLQESEVYALYRFNNDSPAGNKNERLKYLIANIKGSMVDSYSPFLLKEILSSPLNYQSVYVKLSIWNLFRILDNTRSLKISQSDKIRLLEKINPALDPIYKMAQTSIMRIYSESGQWHKVLEVIRRINQDYLPYVMSDDIRLFEARAYMGTGDAVTALEKYRYLLKEAPAYINSSAVYDLEKKYGKSYLFLASAEIGIFAIPFLKKHDRQYLFHHLDLQNRVFSDPDLFRRAGRLLAEFEPSLLNSFIVRHGGIDKYDYNIVNIAEDLYNYGKYHDALNVLKIIKVYHFPGYYRISSRVAKKLGNNREFLHQIINYLNLEPFDSYAYDSLIEKLLDMKGNYVQEYWDESMTKIPNLPEKGRLVYWYLRSMKQQNMPKLKEELNNYYKYCPGSYYNNVIYQEFIEENKANDYNLSNSSIDSLNHYFSVNGVYPNKIIHLANVNGYIKESNALAADLADATNVIRKDSMLLLAAEYTNLGEYSFGRSLIEYYFKKNNYNDLKKYELLVGMGDFTKTDFLTVYYTRMLLRAYRIPDDPVLLPLAITSRLFPRPHRSIVLKNSGKFNIDEDIIYAIMRQESQFREDAVSSSNAKGLMQVMPATGKFLARRMGIESYSLFDPEISVQMGAKFLADLMSSTGEVKWASIAYNGGPGNLRKWKRRYYNHDFNHFLEKLPSKESRDYCRIILTNLHGYKVVRNFYNK